MRRLEKVPVLQTLHPPAECLAVVDEVEQPSEGVAVDVLNVDNVVLVVGGEGAEKLRLKDGAGDGEKQFVTGHVAAVREPEGDVSVLGVGGAVVELGNEASHAGGALTPVLHHEIVKRGTIWKALK